jgi:hypothetical protein
MGKFADIKIGTVFVAGGERFRKTDELNYESLENPGYEIFVSPMFEAKIGKTEVPKGIDTSAKFVTDPQTRITKLNPNYVENPAVVAFGEMWGSGEFDCGPENYDFMAEESIKAMKALNKKRNAMLRSTAAKKAVAKKKATKKSSKKR